MPTHVTTKTWSRVDGGARITTAESDTADGEVNIDAVISTTLETRIDLAISASRIKHLYLLADENMTVRTNDASTGTPVDVLTLVADHVRDYSATSGTTGPFSADVTAFYVQLATAASGNLQIRVLQDATP